MAGKKPITPDDDIPEMTSADFTRTKPMRAVMPDVLAALKRGPGRPAIDNPKVRISLRLDPEVLAAYRATGDGWQSRINDTLARAISHQGKTPKTAKRA